MKPWDFSPILSVINLNSYTDADKVDGDRIKKLHLAIADSSVSEIENALFRDPRLVDVLLEEESLLSSAVRRKNALVVSLLLANGAGHTARWPNGETIWHLAVQAYSQDVFELLIGNLPILDVKAADGKAVLDLAVEASDQALVERLISAGFRKFNPFTAIRNTECFVLLVNARSTNIFQINRKGCSLLHAASMYSNAAMVKSLLCEGLDPNREDAEGRTPLHYAAKNGNLHITMLLVINGAIVNGPKGFFLLPNPSKFSPLIFDALESRDLATIQYILQQQVNVNAESKTGETALTLALKLNLPDHTILDLLDYGARLANAASNPLELAFKQQRDDLIATLMKRPDCQQHFAVPLAIEHSADATVCPICRDAIVAGDLRYDLPCAHHFHIGCMNEWLKTSPKCPLCQKMVPSPKARSRLFMRNFLFWKV